MDYLVFAIGLLLLSSAVASILLYREDRAKSRWPLMVIALLVLAITGWADLILFASGSSGSMPLIRMMAGVFSCIFLGCFAVRPFEPTANRAHFFKKLLIPLASVTALLLGGQGDSFGLIVPVGLSAFAAGWEVARIRWGRNALVKSSCGIAFALVAIIQVMPNVVETIFDVNKSADETPRLLTLAILSAATASAVTLTCILWSLRAKIASRKDHYRPGLGSRIIVAAFVVTLVYGAWLTHWLGTLAQEEQSSRLLSAVRLGADTLDAEQVELIQGRTEEVMGEPFRSQHAKLRKVLAAFPKSRFAYLVGKRDNKRVFLCDAEDPESREFSPPGEVYDAQPAKWEAALQGREHFGGPDRDRWGVWFTAIQPVISETDGRIVAALGVDYPATEWLRPMAARRIAAMIMILSVACLVLVLQAFNLISNEKNHRVDVLSERLSDAMDAAELDTWEWFPRSGRLSVGPRIAATLGYADPTKVKNLLQLWRRVHPSEREPLRRMMMLPPEETQEVSEIELRFRDGRGEFRWFMVRGRVVEVGPAGEALRMTGTILNIDASYRARLEIEKQRRFALRVMESVPTGLAVVTSDGCILYTNGAFASLARRTPAELKNAPIDSLIAGADKLTTEGIEKRLDIGPDEYVSVQAFRADLHEAEEGTASIVSLIDLSSIKAAESEAKQSRAEARRLALVATRTDNAVVITDREGRIEWVNEGFTRMSGYTKEEVTGLTPGSVLQDPHADSEARRLMKERVRQGLGFDVEVLNHAKDGRQYLVHIECQPLLDRQGVLTGFMAIERDVTRERRSSILLEAVATISTTLLSSGKVVEELWPVILEQLGRALGADRCHLFRCHPHAISGRPSASRIACWESTGERPRYQAAMTNLDLESAALGRWNRRLAAGAEIAGPVSSMPLEERPPLEQQKILSLVVVPVLAGGNFWGFMSFDACTEARRWETWEIALLKSAAANIGLRLVAEQESDALRYARDEAHEAAQTAERANRAKTTFLATMSHEIRTPLNAVIGMASLLETTTLSVVQKDYAETILRSSHFLLELINDILDYSRIESGRIELDRSPFLLSEVCQGAFDVVRVGSMGKPLEIICRIDPRLPLCFRGDSARVRQILVNLLGNSIKFTPEGFVSLIVKGEALSENRWKIDFDVADSGIGIAPDSLDKLFKPFTQEDSSTTRRFGGSGLGLAISKRLAGLMDGDITVTSSPGVGSVFRLSVTLDLAPVMVASRLPAPHLPAEWKPRVLVVDDNDLNRRVLEEILSSLNLPCLCVEGAFSALRVWKENGPFDVVITDYHMPTMDGAEMVRHLREMPDVGDCQFVLLGSDNSYGPDVHDLFHAIGTKPVWSASLTKLLCSLSPARLEAAVAPTARTASNLKELKILVAEDNPNNQKVIRLLLRQLGIDPKLVNDGRQAIEAAHAGDYDVILMDVQMPVMDGLAAARELRKSPPTRTPYIIALTADAFREDREAVLAAGMNLYLAKPVTLVRLREALTTAVEAIPRLLES